MLGSKFGEAGLGYRIREDVRQAISAGCYRVASLALRRDMDDDKSVAPMSRGDHVFELLLCQSRICMLVDDLDVIPALRDPGVDECLHIITWTKSRDRRSAHLGRMAARDGDAGARSVQIGSVLNAVGSDLVPQRQARIGAPHLKLRRDAKVQ